MLHGGRGSGGTARIGVSVVWGMSCGSGEGRSARRTRGILVGFKTAGFQTFGRETQYETGFACIWESSLILRQRGVHRSENPTQSNLYKVLRNRKVGRMFCFSVINSNKQKIIKRIIESLVSTGSTSY